jgi:hypothetical protein
MKREHFASLASGLALSILYGGSAGASAPASTPHSPPRQHSIGGLPVAYGKLPLGFEANAGQTDGQVKFLARGRGYTLFLTGNEAVLDLPSVGAANVLRMKLDGANLNAVAIGADQLAGKSNYFIGNDPNKWQTNVPNYAKVKYADVYPGVDLVYYGNLKGQLEYDFVVAPGADPAAITLSVAADHVRATKGGRRSSLRIADNGDLIVKVGGSEIRFNQPVVYQMTQDAKRALIQGHFVLKAPNQVHFALGPYDRSKVLIIDPVLIYSTYLGGNDYDQGFGIAVDSAGSAYVTGYAGSLDFPTVNPLPYPSQGAQAFVTKFNPAGSALVYSTYLGGSFATQGNAIAVDSSGSAYVTGQTRSIDFPTVNPVQPTNTFSNSDAFVSKLSPDGSALVYSTYLGGNTPDLEDGGGNEGFAIAVDSAGNAYVGGQTADTDFPLVNALDTTLKTSAPSSGTGFMAKYNAAGSALIYSTYLGGSSEDVVWGIAADSAGNAYATGYTFSADFPTANAFQPICNSCPYATYNGFITKINPTGSAFVYSTFLGGSDTNDALAIAADAAGNAYVTGTTTSTDFPTMNPLQASNAGNGDAFITKINATGSALVYSTYFGGASGADVGRAIAVDSSGAVYVAGSTGSTDFPVLNPIQATKIGGLGPDTGFVLSINAAGSALIYSTFLGGNLGERVQAIAVDSSHNAYVTGYTYSLDFPTANPYQPANNGQVNAFVSKLPAGTAGSSPPTVTVTVTPTTITVGQSSSLTWSSTNATSCTASGGWTGTQATNGTVNESPTASGTTTYTLTCTGTGGSAQASATLTVTAAAPTVTLSVNPTSVTIGQSATLTWSTTNATACTASGAWTGSEETNGTQSVTPTATGSSTYTLTCSGAGGSAHASAALTVNAAAPAPTVTLSITPASITVGQSATLTWSSSNATSCTASGAWSGTQATSGMLTVTPTAAGAASYTLVCSGAASASATSAVNLTVTAQLATVTVLSGKAGGGGLGLWSLLGLSLLVASRLRRGWRPVLGALAGYAVLAALVAPAPVSAQEASPSLQFNWDQTYVGIRAGRTTYWESSAQLDSDLVANGESGTTTSINQHRVGGVLYAGVPFFGPLSLEFGLADLGEYPVGIRTTSTNIPQLAQTIVRNLSPAGRGLTLNLAAPLDIASWFAVEPRLGLLGYQSKQEVFTPMGTFSHDREGGGFDAGLALLLRPTSSIYIGAGVDCFETGGSRCDVLLYSAQIEYHFGR